MRAALAMTVVVFVACGPRSQPPPAQHGPHGQQAPPPGYGYGPPPGPPNQGPPGAVSGDVAQVPPAVQHALADYVRLLATSQSLDECAQRFTSIAGGSLVNEDGRTLRDTVKPYSLKKDWQNVRFYEQPPRVTRVDIRQGQTEGYGPSAISGTEYKIWIAKRQGQPGMPAPISIIVPANHPFVQGPRIAGIGSL